MEEDPWKKKLRDAPSLSEAFNYPPSAQPVARAAIWFTNLETGQKPVTQNISSSPGNARWPWSKGLLTDLAGSALNAEIGEPATGSVDMGPSATPEGGPTESAGYGGASPDGGYAGDGAGMGAGAAAASEGAAGDG